MFVLRQGVNWDLRNYHFYISDGVFFHPPGDAAAEHALP
jgi:hypothetical protein